MERRLENCSHGITEWFFTWLSQKSYRPLALHLLDLGVPVCRMGVLM